MPTPVVDPRTQPQTSWDPWAAFADYVGRMALASSLGRTMRTTSVNDRQFFPQLLAQTETDVASLIPALATYRGPLAPSPFTKAQVGHNPLDAFYANTNIPWWGKLLMQVPGQAVMGAAGDAIMGLETPPTARPRAYDTAAAAASSGRTVLPDAVEGAAPPVAVAAPIKPVYYNRISPTLAEREAAVTARNALRYGTTQPVPIPWDAVLAHVDEATSDPLARDYRNRINSVFRTGATRRPPSMQVSLESGGPMVGKLGYVMDVNGPNPVVTLHKKLVGDPLFNEVAAHEDAHVAISQYLRGYTNDPYREWYRVYGKPDLGNRTWRIFTESYAPQYANNSSEVNYWLRQPAAMNQELYAAAAESLMFPQLYANTALRFRPRYQYQYQRALLDMADEIARQTNIPDTRWIARDLAPRYGDLYDWLGVSIPLAAAAGTYAAAQHPTAPTRVPQ